MEPYNRMNWAELNRLLNTLIQANETTAGGSKRRALLRQLEVHQVELEMQNLELQESHQQLEASRNRYADLYDSSAVGYLSLDERGCIVETNLTGASMLDEERSSLAGKPFVLFIAPGEAPLFFNHLKQCLSLREPVTTEVTLQPGEKPPIPVQMISVASIDPARKVKVCRTTLIDFAERKRAEEALRESEERFRQLAENITEVFWMTSHNKSELLYISPAYEKVFGRTCESAYEHPTGWIDAIHPEDRERIGRLAGTDQASGGYDQEFRIIRPDGSVRWIRDRAFPIKDKSGRTYRLTGIAEDITERKRTEKALEEYAARMQTLSSRLMEAQESERRRIARELHDEIGQSLTAIKIQLHAAQHHPATRTSKLEDCMEMVDQALAEVQSLSLKLHPSQLDELGLVAALRWHLDRQANAAELTPHFWADPLPSRLQPDLEIACFRVTQEALTNVVRHADARKVSVELRYRETGLSLIIEDDGKGFDVETARHRAIQGASLGLIGMQERVELAGGRLGWISSPGKGTKVHAVFPLAHGNPKMRPKRKKP